MSLTLGLAFAFAGSFLFGLTAVILKMGTQNQNLFVSLVIRSAASVPFLLLINLYRVGFDFYTPFMKTSTIFFLLLTSSALLTGDILLMNILKRKPVGIITPIIAINPLFSTILLMIFGEAAPTIYILILTIIIIFGVFLVTYESGSNNRSSIDFEVLLFGLSIAFLWGLTTFVDIIILKDDNIDGLTFTAMKIIFLSIIGFLIFILLGVRNSFRDYDFTNYKSIKYMLLAGFVGWVMGAILVYSSFDTGPPELIVPIIGLNPLFAVIISLVLKFESINKVKAVGIFLCISSSILLVI